VPAVLVDHIIPHRGDTTLLYDQSNLQSLCTACHNRKTNTEDGGFGTTPVDRERGSVTEYIYAK
jgi:5-methylcytosine-specific restriction protein A